MLRYSGVPESGADEKVKVDSGATAGYLGAAFSDGVLRTAENVITVADGGNYITLTLADHNTARTAIGLAIGTDVAAQSHAMSTHSDETTYDISTSGKATVTEGYIHGAETTATPSAAFTVDWGVKQVQRVTITGTNLDVTFTDPAGPCRLCLVVVQGDGSDTIDWTNEASILWPGATDPTLSTGSGDVDVITFYYDGDGSYYGVANYDFG